MYLPSFLTCIFSWEVSGSGATCLVSGREIADKEAKTRKKAVTTKKSKARKPEEILREPICLRSRSTSGDSGVNPI